MPKSWHLALLWFQVSLFRMVLRWPCRTKLVEIWTSSSTLRRTSSRSWTSDQRWSRPWQHIILTIHSTWLTSMLPRQSRPVSLQLWCFLRCKATSGVCMHPISTLMVSSIVWWFRLHQTTVYVLNSCRTSTFARQVVRCLRSRSSVLWSVFTAHPILPASICIPQ